MLPKTRDTGCIVDSSSFLGVGREIAKGEYNNTSDDDVRLVPIVSYDSEFRGSILSLYSPFYKGKGRVRKKRCFL